MNKKAYVISIANQKGGIGKSTATLNLAVGLTIKGYKVLMIDLDNQRNITTTCLNVDDYKHIPTIYEVLLNQFAIKECIIKLPNGVDLVRGSKAMSELEQTLKNTGKEYRLKEQLESILKAYDYILIDTAPRLDIGTINALTCSNGVIVPIKSDDYSYNAIDYFYKDIYLDIKKYTNKDLKILGLLVNIYNSRSNISKAMVEAFTNEVAPQIKTKVFNTKIRECIAVVESQHINKSVIEYKPNCKASVDYLALTDEIIKDTKGV